MISLEQKKIIEQRRNEIEIRIKNNQTVQQIVDALKDTPLEASKRIIGDDIRLLRKCGRLGDETIEEKIIRLRRDEVEIRTKDNQTEQQIVDALKGTQLETSIATVRRDRKFLRECGRLENVNEEEIIEQRRNEVEIRTKDNQTAQQIEDALKGTPLETNIGKIESDRRFLRDQGRLEAVNEEERVAKEMQAIKVLVEANKKNKEIAEIRGISIGTVVRYKKILREQNNLNTLNYEEKIQLVGKLRNKGKKINQIEKETGMSRSTIIRYIKKIKEQEREKLNEKVQKLYENFYGQTDTVKKFEEYLTLCKERYEQKMIDEKDLIAIKCAAISTQRYENIVFYIKLCIRFNQFEEAIKFAHDYINYETFSQEEKEKIKKSKEECQKYFKAINMIKQKINDEQIKEISGVSKVELAILKKKVEKQDNKDKKIGSNGENENSEELSL